jgi:hypothetical protein
MVPMPLNTKKQKDNQEPQKNPHIIRTQGHFTRLIEKRTGTEVKLGKMKTKL